jgi:hypothetical protein
MATQKTNMEEVSEGIENPEQALSSMKYADPPLDLGGRTLQTPVNDTASTVMDSTTEELQSTTKPSAPAETTTVSHALLVPSPKANTIIRYVMTAVASLLIVAAFLSIATATQYRFLLGCVWTILLFFFIGFCYFIQETVINDASGRRRQIFHPAVHAMGDWIASGIKNFVEDCQNEYAVLLLSNEAAYDHYRQFDATATQPDGPGPTRPRTKLFRAVVQPIMNVAFWRRRKHRRRKQNTIPHDKATPKNTVEYVPPPTNVV